MLQKKKAIKLYSIILSRCILLFYCIVLFGCEDKEASEGTLRIKIKMHLLNFAQMSSLRHYEIYWNVHSSYYYCYYNLLFHLKLLDKSLIGVCKKQLKFILDAS